MDSSAHAPGASPGFGGFQLKIGEKAMPLAAGVKLSVWDVQGLQPLRDGSTVASVVQHPMQPGVLGIKNESQSPWTATPLTGGPLQIMPDKVLPLSSGVEIDFGAAQGQVVIAASRTPFNPPLHLPEPPRKQGLSGAAITALAVGAMLFFGMLTLTFVTLLTTANTPPAPAPVTLPPTPSLPPPIDKTSQPPVQTPSVDLPESMPENVEFLPQAEKATFFIESDHGEGSGFYISADGLALTNNHVVGESETVTITDHNGEEHTADVVVKNDYIDVAVLRVRDVVNAPAIPLGDSSVLEKGMAVYAIGFPLGSELADDRKTSTLTNGIYSARRQIESMELLQTTAPVNPGNSGGPLLDPKTKTVIGVVVAKVNGAEGIAFALPINSVKSYIDEAKSASSKTSSER